MNRIRNDFSKVVDAYSKYRRDYIDKVYELIYSFCPDKEAKVLDVGCGTGFVTNHLAHHFNNLTGTDKSKKMLDVAKQVSSEKISFLLASTEELPFEDSSFDLVTAGAAYHWFDYDKAGREIFRVLKPSGKLCVFWKYARGNFNGYLPEFAVDNLRKLVASIPKTNKGPIEENTFKNVGFTRVRMEEFDFDDVYSREEILGYIQSHSTFNLLDDKQKEEYKKMNEVSVDKHLKKDTFVFKSRMEMWFVEK